MYFFAESSFSELWFGKRVERKYGQAKSNCGQGSNKPQQFKNIRPPKHGIRYLAPPRTASSRSRKPHECLHWHPTPSCTTTKLLNRTRRVSWAKYVTVSSKPSSCIDYLLTLASKTSWYIHFSNCRAFIVQRSSFDLKYILTWDAHVI